MKQILIFLVFLTELCTADIYVNGEKVGGNDQNATYNGESKNEILKTRRQKTALQKRLQEVLLGAPLVKCIKLASMPSRFVCCAMICAPLKT